MRKRKIHDYSIGLDIGTSSVGYSVVDEKGNLLKFKNRNMWGVRLFSEGDTAKSRRLFRATRRRYDRRRERVRLLQEMCAKDIASVDSDFYLRLRESKLWLEDRQLRSNHNFFDELGFTDHEYYKRFPTIYHLRKHLIQSEEKEDIRLIYLALHHIVKYRGNFLYEGQNFEVLGNEQLKKAWIDLLFMVQDRLEDERIDLLVDMILSEIEISSLTKSQKVERILEVLSFDKEYKNFFTNILKAITGQKANFGHIFGDENPALVKSITLTEEDTVEEYMEQLDDEQIELLELLKTVYSGMILKDIIKGNNVRYLSDAKVLAYEKHRLDLKKLKILYKGMGDNLYKEMFKRKTSKRNVKEKTYSSYSLGDKWCNQPDLYSRIKKELLISKNPDFSEIVSECLADIDSETFLPRATSKANGVIPYQIHLNELQKIIQNQGRFYETLRVNKEKIEQLVTFRIPYFVGPLTGTSKSQFAWMVRSKPNEKIYPWNFDEVVDKESSAEQFILRMTGNCTYLPGEKVIPKKSLLYSEYEVLNEIKQIKANGNFLPLAEKKAIYRDLFLEHKNVTATKLLDYLIREWHYSSDTILTGFQKEDSFASSLTSQIDFAKIFGEVNMSNKGVIETLILWITLFSDKEILKSKVMKNYPFISGKQLDQILKLRYSGWSRLSRKLLEGLSIINEKGYRQTIIDTMRNSNSNFMQVISNKELGFNKLIESEVQSYVKLNTDNFVDDLVTSPKTKRSIKQSLLVVEEIVHIMGKHPNRISLEFAKQEGQKKRTKSRYNQIEDKYKEFIRSNDIQELMSELKTRKDSLSDKKLVLYFEQHGKCLYSGKRLNIETLSQDCEVDHIIPQSYIKDDSFENLALVLKGENQKKSDQMLIHPEIIRKQNNWWQELKRMGHIGDKKYKNLTRPSFSENELKGFINRQLVETRQIIKHVANLYRIMYPDTVVHEIKSDLIHNLRNQFGYVKVREVNDFHHAHDAFLTSVMSYHIVSCYPKLTDEFDYTSYIKFASDRLQALRRAKNGYLVGRFADKVIDRKTGEVIWEGEKEVKRIRECLEFKDCFISKKVEENTGAFYDQTLYSPSEMNKLNRIKDSLPIERYGGYSSDQYSYFVLVEIDNGKKKTKRLMGIPIRVAAKAKKDTDAIVGFLKSDLKTTGVRILLPKINRYQLLQYNEHLFYLSSAEEIHNAKQLILKSEYLQIIEKILTNPQSVDDEDFLKLYNCLVEKVNIHYSFYESFALKLVNARSEFILRNSTEKAKVILEILKVTKASPIRGNFAALGFGGMSTSEGRKTIVLDIDKVTFIHTSITGMLSNAKMGSDIQ